jgi:hypothetical protein
MEFLQQVYEGYDAKSANKDIIESLDKEVKQIVFIFTLIIIKIIFSHFLFYFIIF